jgi:uncharacterized repeat protein (TIGR03803 family)
MMILWAVTLAVVGQSAQAQTEKLLHIFTGGSDGAQPQAGLVMDRAGNFYGTARYGGYYGGNCSPLGCGTVFELARSGSGWILKPLYSFTGGNDGESPAGPLSFGPDGALYGTTVYGGSNGCESYGCGTVFRLAPPATVCHAVSCPWDETLIVSFGGGATGLFPYGGVIFDPAGNIYGTTYEGGVQADCDTHACGIVYKLSPANGNWLQTVLYTFSGSNGAGPEAGLTFDATGNLYGTTAQGGTYDQGIVFRLSPSGSGWVGGAIHEFTGESDGGGPLASVIFDAAGNLYSDTAGGGAYYGGTAFELTPSNGSWTEIVLKSFTSVGNGPTGPLAMGSNGSLYGNTSGETGSGSVFELTPENGGWIYTDLYDFSGGSGGYSPLGGLLLDASGNLYGTTSLGGDQQCEQYEGCGVIFEITP